MFKACARICTFAFALASLLSTAYLHAQTISINFSCPHPNPPNPPTTYGFVTWSAPTTETAPVELWESSYGRYAQGEQRLGTGYSGESTEISFNLATTYVFSLYANNQNLYAPSGTLLDQRTENCNGSSHIAAASIPIWGEAEVESLLDSLNSCRSIDKATASRKEDGRNESPIESQGFGSVALPSPISTDFETVQGERIADTQSDRSHP